ncbi:hypothetical protein CC85DRAFT_308055 [Cutaneotrichosporon oleaginosum]|uniref:Nudix hydrolase domain-containing protein n=1 Tax=Cutaneotrichosporon oleaginosum TaxID=879819 RepID=A0A0J0XMU8_9TREE|nr:uncharacterized protein CC85DRAFT_308055 [Cutaneotrichosporon oleaginosum]KLT42413.1 hypothetical protein CC85DRAFT_308055 [Cutaneotrichosporon oleaginosum]TXT06932.1 hypothetical protein COLE_06263 [Cutaneotrichosporon oleaginosum]
MKPQKLGKPLKAPPVPSPSASIMLLSPTNQLLLLHRVNTSSSFASAHVFPGGNCHAFHDGPIPAPDDPKRHLDGDVYKLAAIRETFEESGILLARDAAGKLLSLSPEVRAEGRKAVHANKIPFPEWVKQHGGVPDTGGLVPFTRWITPPAPHLKKRFTAQMYIYLLPFNWVNEVATHDGGLEHTAADFDDVQTWIKKSQDNEIILFSPQAYLINMLGQFFTGAKDYEAQRHRLLEFLQTVPTGPTDHPTAKIPWADKVMSPSQLPGVQFADGRVVIRNDDPGPELRGTERGGDWDRVIVSMLGKGGRDGGKMMWRKDVLAAAAAERPSEAKL